MLIVIGILIALQINDWNASRQNRALEQTYLKRLEATIEQDIRALNISKQLAEARLGFANLLIESKAKPKVVMEEPARFLVSIRQVGYAIRVPLFRDTFEELSSTGHLSLLSDKLKNELYSYYNSDERMRDSVNADSVLESRHAELSVEALSLEQEMWMQNVVGVFVPINGNSLPEAPFDENSLMETARRFWKKEALINNVLNMRLIHTDIINNTESSINRAERVLAFIQEELEE